METFFQSLEEIFEGNVHYEVPDFQRTYRWTRDDQWEPLWRDVARMAEHLLGEDSGSTEDDYGMESEDREPVHFFGAIVIQRAGKQTPSAPTRWTVIDGQQRLTTIQLLLAAAARAFRDIDSDALEGVAPLVENKPRVYRNVGDYKYKVFPTSRDRAAFTGVIDGIELEGEQASSGIGQCSEFFFKSISSWLAHDGKQRSERAQALETILRFHLNVVLLALDENENQYVIYETLNARGTPLLAWDHIKSFMLNRADAEGHSEEAASNQIGENSGHFGDTWWDTEIGTGYARRSRVDAFLAYWLTMKLTKQVAGRPSNRLAREFQAYADSVAKSGESILDVAAEVGLHSIVFREMEEMDESSRAGLFFSRWRTMNAGVLTPALLWLMTNEIGADQQERSLVAIESFLVRRMICALGTRGYFDVMLGLLKRLDEAGVTHAGDAVVGYLSEQTSDRQSWPTNETFQRHLAFERQYGRTGVSSARLRMTLMALDREMQSKKTELDSTWKKVEVEHIMPQDWGDCYPLDDFAVDGDSDEDPAQRRARLLHAIGNLTLVTPNFNGAVSNKCWPEKREEFQRFTASALNLDLLNHAGDEWREADIVTRGERLAVVARKVWPGPQ